MASVPGFAYSETPEEEGRRDRHLDAEKLGQWLTDPAKYAGGPVKMGLKLSDENERKAVIEYLATRK